jgi:hypothetical protein
MEKKLVYEALNPRGIKSEVKITPLTPRVSNLSGKVVYCVSQHIGNADIFQKKVAEHLAKYAPGVEAVYVSKEGWYGVDEPELWNEIATKGNALIYAAAA